MIYIRIKITIEAWDSIAFKDSKKGSAKWGQQGCGVTSWLGTNVQDQCWWQCRSSLQHYCHREATRVQTGPGVSQERVWSNPPAWAIARIWREARERSPWKRQLLESFSIELFKVSSLQRIPVFSGSSYCYWDRGRRGLIGEKEGYSVVCLSLLLQLSFRCLSC